MTALTKIYDANLDITDANIQDVSGDVTKTTYIRIPVTLPTSGQISLSIGGYNSEVEQPGPYISSATLRALDVLVAGYNRDRSKSVPFTFLNMLFGGNTQVNDVIVWAGRNAANELLLVFEIDNETPTGSGSAASYQDVRNIDPNPLVVNHLTLSPEDSFNLPTTDDSAAIVDTDLMVMLPADVSGQTRVNPVMQSWADLKADTGAATNLASINTNTANIATNKGASDANSANIAANTTNIATNTAGVAANLATLNALPDYGPPGLVVDFTITSWDYLDSDDGVPPGSEYYRWNGAPNPTGTIAAGADLTFTPKATALTINEVQWRTNSLRFFGASGTDDTFGPDIRSNTALSLYVFYDGLPNASPRVVELELASGTDFAWGASAQAIQFAGVSEPLAPIPGGFVEGTAVRFLIAKKGELDRISVFLGVQHPYPTYTLIPFRTQIGSTFIKATGVRNGYWYNSGLGIDYDPQNRNKQLYEVWLGFAAQSSGSIQQCIINFSGEAWHSFSLNPLTSGVTQYANTHITYFLSTGPSAGVYIGRGPAGPGGHTVWFCPIAQNNDPGSARVSVFRHGWEITTVPSSS